MTAVSGLGQMAARQNPAWIYRGAKLVSQLGTLFFPCFGGEGSLLKETEKNIGYHYSNLSTVSSGKGDGEVRARELRPAARQPRGRAAARVFLTRCSGGEDHWLEV